MDTRKHLFALSLLFALVIGESTDCNCGGPIKYYQQVGCTPVYENAGDCCPVRYDCEHLKNLPEDRCIANGNFYEVGEQLRDEDANPCDIGCRCLGDKRPTFVCAAVDCPFHRAAEGCFLDRKANECCASGQICPEKEEDRATCVVGDKTYKEGEYFSPEGEPNKNCYCRKGYTGENVEPFCYTLKHECSLLHDHPTEAIGGCVPTYYYSQSPQTSCSVASRCPNVDDKVIAKSVDSLSEGKSVTTAPESPEMQCHFGNLTMNLGDELNQATDYSSVCMKCVCEVPPVPTCQRLPDEECDVTKHAKFD